MQVFFGRYWQIITGALVALALLAMLAVRTHQRDEALDRLVAERAAADLFAARVQAKAEAISARLAEHALRIGRVRSQISTEVSGEYQSRLAALRVRIAGLQRGVPDGVRDAAGAGAGSAGQDRVPGLPGAAGGPDGAAAASGLPAADAILATEQAIQLDELQRWIRRQQGVDDAPPQPPD